MVFIILFLTVGLYGIIHYDGDYGNVNISGYAFIADNKTQTMYLAIETAELREIGHTETPEYVSKMIISTERASRTDASQVINMLLFLSISGLVVVLMIDLSVTSIRVFPYYAVKFSVFQTIIKVIEMVAGITIAILLPFYINCVIGMEANLSVGYSLYVLVVLSVMQTAVWLILNAITKKKIKEEILIGKE